MTIQDLGSIADFVAALAVVISLVYLAIQVRHHTRELHRQSFRDVFGAYSQFRRSVVGSPTASELVFKAREAPGDLTDAELYRLGYLVEELGWCTQQLHALVEEGMISKDVWPAGRQRLLDHLESEPAQKWWKDWSHMYDPALVRDINLALGNDAET